MMLCVAGVELPQDDRSREKLDGTIPTESYKRSAVRSPRRDAPASMLIHRMVMVWMRWTRRIALCA